MARETGRLEKLEGPEWRLELEVDAAAVAAAVERRLGQLRPRATAPGFRPGKAPPPLLRRLYGPELRRRAVSQLALAAVRRELAARGLQPLLAPRLEELEDGARVAAYFELFPELPPLDLAGLELRRAVAVIGEDDIDYMIERLGGQVEGGRADAARRQELRRVMEAEAPEAAFEETAEAVEEALIAAHPGLEVPASLLQAETEELRRAGVAEPEAPARRRLAGVLLLAQAARQEGVKLPPEALWEETERLAAASRDPQEELDRLWADGRAIQEIEERLLRRRVVEAVLTRARVTEAPTRFAELARRRRG